jgi:hypothetical protein
MTMIDEKWKADPKRGEEFLTERRAEIVSALQRAADIAYAAIEEKLLFDIEQLKKKAGDKKAQISKSVDAAETRPVMEIVRKYWNETPETMWRHFVHNMAENEGKP